MAHELNSLSDGWAGGIEPPNGGIKIRCQMPALAVSMRSDTSTRRVVIQTQQRYAEFGHPTRSFELSVLREANGAIVSHFVEFNGAAVKSVKSGFRSAVGIAKLSTEAGKVTPHTLRHTAATWLMQRGADPWKSAGFLGMSVEVLLDTYGHHHPEFLREAAAAITTKPSKNIVSGVDRGVDLAAYRERRRKAKENHGRSGRIRTCDPCVPNAVNILQAVDFLAVTSASISFCSRSFHPIRCDFVAA